MVIYMCGGLRVYEARLLKVADVALEKVFLQLIIRKNNSGLKRETHILIGKDTYLSAYKIFFGKLPLLISLLKECNLIRLSRSF